MNPLDLLKFHPMRMRFGRFRFTIRFTPEIVGDGKLEVGGEMPELEPEADIGALTEA